MIHTGVDETLVIRRLDFSTVTGCSAGVEKPLVAGVEYLLSSLLDVDIEDNDSRPLEIFLVVFVMIEEISCFPAASSSSSSSEDSCLTTADNLLALLVAIATN